MAEDSWEDWDDENFDPEVGFAKKDDDGNPWEGEDEGLDLSAAAEPEPTPKSADAKPKQSKEERIAEKKAQRRAEELAKKAEQEEAVKSKPLTHEEKLRQQKLQEESDLAVAMETFGVSVAQSGTIESMHPNSEEEFNDFSSALSKKITEFKTSPMYVKLMERLILSTCEELDVEDLRHLSKMLSTLATEKQKAKTAKTKKKVGKASLGARAVGKAAKRHDTQYENDLGAEFDDFM